MKKRNLCLLLLSIIFIILTALVITNNTKIFDEKIYQFIISFRTDYLDIFFKTITKLGNTIPILVMTIIFLIILNKHQRIQLGLSIISSVILNQTLKNIIMRERPNVLRLIKQGGYSFPSGHAMISICFYGLLLYFVIKHLKSKKLKYLLSSILIFIIITIGLSRVYLGVHYPSDILAGYTLSSIILIILITLTDKYFRGNKNDKDGCK